MPKQKNTALKEVDLSTPILIINKVLRDYRNNEERLEIVRGDNNKREYLLRNPKMKLKMIENYYIEFIPDYNIKPHTVRNYYINVPHDSQNEIGVRIKISFYKTENLGNLGLPTEFNIINSIIFFKKTANTKTSFSAIPRLTYPINSHGINCYTNKKVNSTGWEEHYFSTIPNKSKCGIEAIPPLTFFSILPFYIPFVDNTKGGKGKKVYLNELLIRNKKNTFSYDFFADLLQEIIPACLSYVHTVLMLHLPNYIDLSLFEFFMYSEIPEMCVLYWKYEILGDDYFDLISEVSDHDIDFFNRLAIIKKLSGTNAADHILVSTLLQLPIMLSVEKRLQVCKACNKFFKYKKGKLYCSSKCRKSAESCRYYKRNREKILAYSREEMKKTRSFVRELLSKNK
ncbi:MAG: hypothetical protein AB1746_10205 [Candidatus Zixiibacteriota bacterium]